MLLLVYFEPLIYSYKTSLILTSRNYPYVIAFSRLFITVTSTELGFFQMFSNIFQLIRKLEKFTENSSDLLELYDCIHP